VYKVAFINSPSELLLLGREPLEVVSPLPFPLVQPSENQRLESKQEYALLIVINSQKRHNVSNKSSITYATAKNQPETLQVWSLLQRNSWFSQ